MAGGLRRGSERGLPETKMGGTVRALHPCRSGSYSNVNRRRASNTAGFCSISRPPLFRTMQARRAISHLRFWRLLSAAGQAAKARSRQRIYRGRGMASRGKFELPTRGFSPVSVRAKPYGNSIRNQEGVLPMLGGVGLGEICERRRVKHKGSPCFGSMPLQGFSTARPRGENAQLGRRVRSPSNPADGHVA
jgi:hypothetical protein